VALLAMVKVTRTLVLLLALLGLVIALAFAAA
jgi:hypothetical protein